MQLIWWVLHSKSARCEAGGCCGRDLKLWRSVLAISTLLGNLSLNPGARKIYNTPLCCNSHDVTKKNQRNTRLTKEKKVGKKGPSMSHLASDVCSHTSVTGRSSWRSKVAELLHRASSSSHGRSRWSNAASQPGRRWWSPGLKTQLIKQNTSLQQIVISTGLGGWVAGWVFFLIKAGMILQTLKNHIFGEVNEKRHSLPQDPWHTYILHSSGVTYGAM